VGVLEVLRHMFGACEMKIMQQADWLKTISYNCTVILFEPLQFA
jgi:hypothetical protein